ncbi:hypothetical protein BDV26DRAFT_254863 [Aspergillus bertholletiae]|uniref:Uncharacterized protein n=1 Tax=Aspergillus bertholletiae TaxID=1226010 RepID=A0A5N7BIQ6_9EURO|nr:hypothetical protein BDV26DRAFT_254863 [Aspergillus bertholletiae]
MAYSAGISMGIGGEALLCTCIANLSSVSSGGGWVTARESISQAHRYPIKLTQGHVLDWWTCVSNITIRVVRATGHTRLTVNLFFVHTHS